MAWHLSCLSAQCMPSTTTTKRRPQQDNQIFHVMYCWLLSGQVYISCFGQNYVQDLDSLNYNQSDYLIVTCYTLNTFTAIFSSHHSASAQVNHKQVAEGSRYAPTTKQYSSPLTHLSEGNEATRWRRLSSYVWWAPLSWRYTYVYYMYIQYHQPSLLSEEHAAIMPMHGTSNYM